MKYIMYENGISWIIYRTSTRFNLTYPMSPWSQPLMTWPDPNVKENGLPRGMLESNSLPSSFSVPCKRFMSMFHVSKAKKVHTKLYSIYSDSVGKTKKFHFRH